MEYGNVIPYMNYVHILVQQKHTVVYIYNVIDVVNDTLTNHFQICILLRVALYPIYLIVFV